MRHFLLSFIFIVFIQVSGFSRVIFLDTILIFPDPYEFTPTILLIDINHDGTNDLKITFVDQYRQDDYYSEDFGGSDFGCPNTKVLRIVTETVSNYSQGLEATILTDRLAHGESISNSNSWFDHSLYLGKTIDRTNLHFENSIFESPVSQCTVIEPKEYLDYENSFPNYESYIGVQFNISGHTHYGWISYDKYGITGYAYETISGYPIKAGDKGGFFGSIDPSYNTIKGNVFYDLNGNCIKDLGESGISQLAVYTTTGNFGGHTDNDGNYEVLVNGGTGNYNITLDTSVYGGLAYSYTCAIKSINVNFTGNNQIISGNNFGLKQLDCSQTRVHISSDRRRRCFRNTTTVNYQNFGSLSSADTELKVILPQYVKAISSTPTWDSQNGDTLFYDLGVLQVNKLGAISIIDSVSCFIPGITGLTQCTRAILSPKNNCIVNSLWDNSEIDIAGICSTDIYNAIIKNTGSGNMQDSLAYRIFLNDTLVKTGKFKLAINGELEINIPTNGATVRIEADQNSYHPDKKYSYLAFEGCGTNPSKGFIASMPTNVGGIAESISCLPIVDSYDPNDKSVTPIGMGEDHVVLPNTDLTYTIRFQNTGSDDAYTVVLVDTLDINLDITSLKILASSHPYKFELTGKASPRMVWIFPDINLPPKSVNEPASNGYVTYSVSQNKDVILGTTIKNKAHIFFDYNDAIVTNETFNLIGTYTTDLSRGASVEVINNVKAGTLKLNDLKVYPNPTEASVVVEVSETGLSYEMVNSLGTVLKSGSLTNNSDINLSDLPQGIYSLKIKEGDRFLVKKIVKN